MRVIVTVIGKDKPGIISKVSNELAENNVNIEDISQTIVQGNFTMIMLCDLTNSELVLKDLINANFKNLQRDPKGNLIYTLLPIVDERENNKVRTSLVLYYTSLYYDNVDLLQQMLAAERDFLEQTLYDREIYDPNKHGNLLEYLAKEQFGEPPIINKGGK